MTQKIFYPDWKKIIVYPAQGIQPQALVENEKYKSVIAGLLAGNSIPPQTEGPATFHFLQGTGRVIVDEESFDVQAGATVIVPDGASRSIEAETQLSFLAVRLPR